MSKRKPAQLTINIRTLYWIVWTLGAALVVLGWLHVVSSVVAWIGWGIGGIATVVSVVYNLSAKRQVRVVPERDSDRPAAVSFTKTLIKIDLVDGRSISAPLSWYPKLKKASAEERAQYELQGNGIYWSDLDADVSVLDILDGARPEE